MVDAHDFKGIAASILVGRAGLHLLPIVFQITSRIAHETEMKQGKRTDELVEFAFFAFFEWDGTVDEVTFLQLFQ